MALEANKAFAAVLTAGIAFMVSGVVGGLIVQPHRIAQPAIQVPEIPGAAPAAAPAAAAAPAVEPIAPLLASASADEGRTIAQRQCAACHSFNEGGRNAVGPNLYGVLGGPHAHRSDFNYSAAMASLKDKPWDYEALNAFLAGPARAIVGTRMAFAGLNSAQQRANVIVYLRSLDANPKPLP
ncbi:c-type cytochrome [Roseomonas sp. CCTCC AB2023176]|uniref:c-type cytochrome n=1 Tax=Roseomonas sp. CCTCC AB2023176 TaxID=3342640 RepID=UPI0035D66931